MKNQIRNSMLLALAFLAGAAWANAQSAEQAEAVLRQKIEGAQAHQAGPTIPVRPGEHELSLPLEIAPVAPDDPSVARPPVDLEARGTHRYLHYKQKMLRWVDIGILAIPAAAIGGGIAAGLAIAAASAAGWGILGGMAVCAATAIGGFFLLKFLVHHFVWGRMNKEAK